MTVVFGVLIAIGLVLGAITALLIWRSRSAPPAPAPSADTDSPPGGVAAWFAHFVDAIDYARVRREWRYRLPWILLLGERGAGKTSLSLSAKALAQTRPDPRYASLKVPGSACQVMNSGLLIDVDGSFASFDTIATPAAAPASASASASTSGAALGSTPSSTGALAAPVNQNKNPTGGGNGRNRAASHWDTLLSALVNLRPERPVDGIVLTVSASTLQGATPAELDRLAADAYRQLCDVQDTFCFILPVSVVVTQCDRIDGFAAFWSAQPAALRKQIFGWSAPESTSNDTPRDWSDPAFETVIDELRALQLDNLPSERIDADPNAQTNTGAADTDGRLLFPSRLDALRAPLGQWLGGAFRATVDRPGHRFRGIYFTGDMDGGGVTPRDDVSFVDGLLEDKVFAERGSARVVRASAWSRNRYLRAMQVTALGVAAALTLALAFAGVRLYTTVGRLDRELAQLQTVRPYVGGVCPSASEVSSLLMTVRDLDTRSFDLANPWSWMWFQHPLRNGAAEVVAAHVFASVILPGLSCQLTVRGQDLMARGVGAQAENGAGAGAGVDTGEQVKRARLALNTQLSEVTDLETSLGTYENIAEAAAGASSRTDLQRFAKLVHFAYGLPVSLLQGVSDRGVLAVALNAASTPYRPNLPDNLAGIYTQQLSGMEQQLRDALVQHAGAGQRLLTDLAAGNGDPAAQTRQVVDWLHWTNDNWLNTTREQAASNLCGQIRTDLHQQVQQLVLADASSGLRRTAMPGTLASPYRDLYGVTDTTFSDAGCDAPVHAALDRLSVPPYDPLIVRAQGKRIFNPSFSGEFAGLTALSSLHFMQTTHRREAFACVANGTGAQGWNADSLGDASAYIDEYRRFSQQFASKPAADGTVPARPLYAQIAARQLENALNHAMNDAQRPRPADPGVWPTGTVSAPLSPASSDEPALAQSSRELARGLASLISIERTYSEFGYSGSYRLLSGCLQQFAANRLSTVSSLAVESQLYRPPVNRTGPEFFDLGTVPVTRDYLARQVARAQVLATYAAPFATLSLNSGNAANGGANTQTATYWSRTIAEVNRYVPANDPASQMGLLASLFVDRLTGMSAQNCGARLQNAASPSMDDNDLFAALHRSLLTYADLRCQGSDADAFESLFDSFQATLAGRYPFVSQDVSDAADVSLPAVRSFFADYAQRAATLRAQLATLPSTYRSAVRQFLDQLDADQKFFDATLRGDGTLGVHVNVAFNVRQSAEHGSEQVIGWTLSSAGQAASYPNGQTGLDWNAGQPLALGLTWADLSRWAPTANPPLVQPEVGGRTATFSASGTWALIRFMQQHALEHGGTQSDGTALHFDVPVASVAGVAPASGASPPVASTDSARLILALKMQGVDATSHAAVPLTLPVFPPSAPQLEPIATGYRAPVAGEQIPPIPTLPPLPPTFAPETAKAAAVN